MERDLAVRVVALYVPIALIAVGWSFRSPDRVRAAAALLACGWNLPAILLVNVAATRLGWWHFTPSAGAISGVPSDLLLGWVLLWGAVPVLLLPRAPLLVVVLLLTAIDVAVMPLGEPVVSLGNQWLVGEAFAIATALVPSQLLARWTIADRHVGARASMQAGAFGALTLWMLPELVFAYTDRDWSRLMRHWNAFGGLPLQLIAIPTVMGISAVQEFAWRGCGTPIPSDPPRRLVTSGPYAYVANPMQLAMALVLTGWGMMLGSFWVTLAGPMAVVYGCRLAAWDEGTTLGGRFGASWYAYRRHVRSWIPRLRPFHWSLVAHEDESGDVRPVRTRLYVAASCGRCSEVAAWFAARAPRGLEIVDAERHPTRDLERITYDPCDGGAEETGVAAVARALEHLHLGWALIGWTMRLPLLRPVLQLVVDASGGEPMLIARTGPGRLDSTGGEAPRCVR